MQSESWHRQFYRAINRTQHVYSDGKIMFSDLSLKWHVGLAAGILITSRIFKGAGYIDVESIQQRESNFRGYGMIFREISPGSVPGSVDGFYTMVKVAEWDIIFVAHLRVDAPLQPAINIII